MWDKDPNTFWKLRYGKKKGYFIYDLGAEEKVDGIEIKNVDKPKTHTKEIKVLLSSSQQGPWEEILHEVLPDTREQPLSTLTFGSYGQNKGRFLKCQILDKYGDHAGLKGFKPYKGFLKKKIYCSVISF